MNATDELERSVLGAVILRPDTLALLPSLSTADFAGYRARATWDAIRSLEAAGKPIDLTLLGAELERHEKLEAVGWAYLGECALHVPTIGNAIEYAKQIRDAALRRRLLASIAEIAETASHGATGAELLSMAIRGLSALDAEQPEDASAIGQVVKRRIAQLDQIARERATGQSIMTGFPTGVEKLDDHIGGWQAGIVSIVAARPAMGKSSLGLATADASSKAGHGVHLFSLEDTEASYADRTLSRTSRVHAELLRGADLNVGQLRDVTDAYRKIDQRKGWIVDSRSGISADEIVRSVRRRKKDNGTKVAIVDYVQLVKRPARMSAHEALSEIVTTLADAAKQDGLAYVVMSQLNREIEKRDDKRPQMSDLRESGSLEERAKCIVGVYRGSEYGPPKKGIDYHDGHPAPSEEEFKQQVQLLIMKNSNGRTGVVRAKWDGPITRMD
jgi:replicative DNA helicase